MSFPAQNGECSENVRDKSHSLDDREHGCRILPELANITCALQERATPRCDFSRIAAGKTIFLHFRCSHKTACSMLKQINSIDTGLGKLLGYYPNIQHEMLHRNAAQHDPATCRRRHRRSKNLYWHKTKQTGVRLPTGQRRQSQPGDTTAAERPAGTMDTTHISLIHDETPSPQPRNSTPHATELHPPQLDGHSTSARPSLHDPIPPRRATSKQAATACS